MSSPKISVIIPAYNVEKYLHQCLNSVIGQTLKDIEIICIDDGSTDGSADILKEFQQKDSRVKTVFLDKSTGPLTARKYGVDRALGEYIMFVDSDDYIEPNGCQLAYDKISEMQVDILQFSTKVHNCADIDENKVKNLNEKRLVPYNKLLKSDEVFKAAIIDHKFSYTLWNKIYKTSLCKKAFDELNAQYMPVGEDLLIFFAISYYAKSYYGWNSPVIYNYCFGRGVTGNEEFNLDRFERHCYQSLAVKAMDDFCKKADYKIPGCVEFLKNYKENWLTACVIAWKEKLSKEYASEGLKILFDHWDIKDIICKMIDRYAGEYASVAKKIETMPFDKKETVKTVALYYSRYSTGGTERVMSLLMPMFKDMGYSVVLITEEAPSSDDFELPQGVNRAIIEKTDLKNYRKRLDSWENIVKQNNIDMVIYNAWGSNNLLWDLLYLKALNVSVIAQAHSVFSYRLLAFDPRFFKLTKVYSLLDGVVCLSNVDKLFWETFNQNTYYIPNPVSQDIFDVKPVVWENNSVIWIGRTTYEKNPDAPFEIMRKVVQQVPDAKLYLLGDFDDAKWKQLAEKYNLQNNIIFTGFVSDVESYLAKSSVHLMTSSFEGFPMSLMEAKAHAMPTVMFDMPHLEMGSGQNGTIGVKMMDLDSAAAEIISLLKDKPRWEKYSRNAANCADYYRNYDYKSEWKAVFDGKTPDYAGDSLTKDLVNTIVNHYELGYNTANKPKNTKAANPIKAAVICAKEKGVGYTIKLFFKKIFN